MEARIDDILEDVFIVGVQHGSRTIPQIDKLLAKSRAAIVEAAEGLADNCPRTGIVGFGGIRKEYISIEDFLQAIKEWQT